MRNDPDGTDLPSQSPSVTASLKGSLKPRQSEFLSAIDVIENGSQWLENEYGWRYRNADGTYKTGWLQLGKTWYYLNSYSYHMYEDYIYEIDGDYYAFRSNGALFNGGWYEDLGSWYYADANKGGKLIRGWKKIGNTWYYFEPDSNSHDMYASRSAWINGKKYNFSSSGACLNP